MSNSIQYGSPAKASKVKQLIEHSILLNRRAAEKGLRKTPLCIWGVAGIGKTELVEDYAKEQNFQLAYMAPAQFEEMGDLLGMPVVENGRMKFAAPDWVPRHSGPGILLIDDVNRADDRILRGLMQLFQNGGLVSWQLPDDWHIILAANPDSGDYSVTPLDEAMVGRMRHVVMEFDLSEWLIWAEQRNIDARGIEFVQRYPELLDSGKIAPRSLVHFFESIEPLADLKKEMELVRLLGDASLDRESTATFLYFVQHELGLLPSPADILAASDFERSCAVPIRQLAGSTPPRLDILAHLGDRLVATLSQKESPLSSKEIENIKAFLCMGIISNDLRLLILQQLMALADPGLKQLAADARLGSLLIS